MVPVRDVWLPVQRSKGREKERFPFLMVTFCQIRGYLCGSSGVCKTWLKFSFFIFMRVAGIRGGSWHSDPCQDAEASPLSPCYLDLANSVPAVGILHLALCLEARLALPQHFPSVPGVPHCYQLAGFHCGSFHPPVQATSPFSRDWLTLNLPSSTIRCEDIPQLFWPVEGTLLPCLDPFVLAVYI